MSNPTVSTYQHKGHAFKVTCFDPTICQVEAFGLKGAVRYLSVENSNTTNLDAYAAELSMSARDSEIRASEEEALIALCEMLIEEHKNRS